MNVGIVIGLIKALAQGVDPEIIEQAVMDWLDDHPEATTTVQDGSITEAKLAQDVLADLAEVEELKEAKANIVVSSASGNPAHFLDGADGMAIESLIAEIKATQAAGTPTPTSPIPITGYTGITVYHSGEDTSDPETEVVSWQNTAGEVFFGTVNLTTGVLTATHGYKKYTGTAEAWEMHGSNPRVAVIPWDAVKNKGVTLCNMCLPNDGKHDQPPYGTVENSSYGYNIRVNIISEDMTKAQFKAWLGEHNLEVVCPLITPVEYQIDPITFSTVLGENNVWASTGAIQEIKYRADTKEYIKYANLPDKPSINGIEMVGNKTSADFGMYPSFGRRTCGIFKKVCCIGDSYTAGTMKNTSGASVTDNEYAWPLYIAKQTGNEYVNCGCSGATTATWLTRQDGLAKAQIAENKAQAYTIGLQINDIGAEIPVGTTADIGTQAETYIGYTSQIIDDVFEINNLAHVFLFTQPKTQAGTYQLYNQAIRDIVTWYNTNGNGTHNGQVHLIDLVEQAAIFNEPGCIDSKVSDHFTPVGYEYVAEIIMYAWSKYINAHPLLFQDVNLIPYGAST